MENMIEMRDIEESNIPASPEGRRELTLLDLTLVGGGSADVFCQ